MKWNMQKKKKALTSLENYALLSFKIYFKKLVAFTIRKWHDMVIAGHDLVILLLSFWKLRNFDAHMQELCYMHYVFSPPHL